MEREFMADVAIRQQVEDVVTRMFVATDRRDWAAVEASFTEPFILDMTSMAGGEPASLTPKEVCQAWSDGFQRLDHVHHQIGNFQTEQSNAKARVECYGAAWHQRAAAKGGKTR